MSDTSKGAAKTRFAVEWEATYPPEFGGGVGGVVSVDACRRAEAERDRYREVLEMRILAQLRQATWEAAQYVALTDLERFVADCLDEIRSDTP